MKVFKVSKKEFLLKLIISIVLRGSLLIIPVLFSKAVSLISLRPQKVIIDPLTHSNKPQDSVVGARGSKTHGKTQATFFLGGSPPSDTSL